MAGSRQAIKNRISSVQSTEKITNAMQLVASAKLNKSKQKMERNREYASSLQNLMDEVLAAAGTSNPYLRKDDSLPSVVFVITSDMGLCGGYNSNVLKELEKEIADTDWLIMIGSRGAAYATSRNKHVKETIVDLNDDNAYYVLSNAVDKALQMYDNHEIGSIKVLYTHYKNTLTFEPTVESLLPPPAGRQPAKRNGDTIFEPGREQMLEQLIPMITKSVLFAKYMESKTSEQASRRMAMENATDNAEELMEKLNLEYNRIRQSAITQEITEIVSGANALK